MNEKERYTKILGIVPPWELRELLLDLKEERIHNVPPVTLKVKPTSVRFITATLRGFSANWTPVSSRPLSGVEIHGWSVRNTGSYRWMYPGQRNRQDRFSLLFGSYATCLLKVSPNRRGAKEHVPQADSAHDKFHSSKYLNDSVD